MGEAPVVSVIMPCLNEESVVKQCVECTREGLSLLGVPGEIIIVDNGSTDRSSEMAQAAGARVVHERRRGYGSALMAGFAHARGEVCVMGDADGSYDFRQIPDLIRALDQGYDLVIGSRLDGMIQAGAMPWMHRYIGNPLLTGVLNLFFRLKVRDAHSGFRAIRRATYETLRLRMDGMEFASEMLVAARQRGLRVTEVPIRYLVRTGSSKLRRWRDGWRHLRFMLLYSPTYLFLIPAALFCVAGLVSVVLLLPGPLVVGHRHIDVHVMVLGSLFLILGWQVGLMGICAKVYAQVEGLIVSDRLIPWVLRHVSLERGLTAGSLLLLAGFLIDAAILWGWVRSGFGTLSAFREALFASTLMILGLQSIFAAFLANLLMLKRRSP